MYNESLAAVEEILEAIDASCNLTVEAIKASSYAASKETVEAIEPLSKETQSGNQTLETLKKDVATLNDHFLEHKKQQSLAWAYENCETNAFSYSFISAVQNSSAFIVRRIILKFRKGECCCVSAGFIGGRHLQFRVALINQIHEFFIRE
jgi:hypothetical protein